MGQDYILYFIHALLSSHQTSQPVRLSTLPHSITESFKSGLTRILSRSIGSDHNVTSFSPKSHDHYNRFLGIISNYGDICWSLVISQILNDILTSFFLLSTSYNQLNEEFNHTTKSIIRFYVPMGQLDFWDIKVV